MKRKYLIFYITYIFLNLIIPCFCKPRLQSFERTLSEISSQGDQRQFEFDFDFIINVAVKNTRTGIDIVSLDLYDMGEDVLAYVKNATKSLAEILTTTKKNIIETVATYKQYFVENINGISTSITYSDCMRKGLAKGETLFETSKTKDLACINSKVQDVLDTYEPLTDLAKQATNASIDAMKESADCISNENNKLIHEPCLLKVLAEYEAKRAWLSTKKFVLEEKINLDSKILPVNLLTCNVVKTTFESGVEIANILADTSKCLLNL